jgi:hypothetical protein
VGGFVATLWATLRDLYTLLDWWGALLFVSVADLLLWRKYGFWVPRYVHLLAAGALGLILWLNWMWVSAGGEFTMRRGIVIALFPLLVYFIFVSHGGVKAAARARSRTSKA